MEPLRSILGPFGISYAIDLILKLKLKKNPLIHPDIIIFLNVKIGDIVYSDAHINKSHSEED